MVRSIWNNYFAQNTAQLTNSVIRDLLHLTEQPSVISFAGGLPAPECFPAEELSAAAEQIIANNPVAALQYGLTEGYPPLRDLLIEHLHARQIDVCREELLLTAGSQQALDLLGRILIDPGSTIAVEDPTYLGALQSWRLYNPTYLTVPVDAEGLDVAALEQMLINGAQPRFLYIMSCFQNPTGVTLSPARREALLDLAVRFDLPIIEDDAYGELYYNDERPQPLAALDVARHGRLRYVAYLSSFSKLLAPGLRTGWVAASSGLIDKLVQVKQGTDLHTNSLAQAMIYQAVCDGLLERHVPYLRNTYRQRRDAMLAAFEQHVPVEVSWVVPEGGMFIWLTLPPYADTMEMLKLALEHDVAFVPGLPFYANGGGSNTMRLNFSHASRDDITAGIQRLAPVIERMI
jgi:2-aminoadipate transaminase